MFAQWDVEEQVQEERRGRRRRPEARWSRMEGGQGERRPVRRGEVEIMGGYSIIEATSYDEAATVAAECPISRSCRGLQHRNPRDGRILRPWRNLKRRVRVWSSTTSVTNTDGSSCNPGAFVRRRPPGAMIEDAVQTAPLVTALTSWNLSGVPREPGAWLLQVARHRMLDVLRRGKTADRVHTPEQAWRGESDEPAATRRRRSWTKSPTTSPHALSSAATNACRASPRSFSPSKWICGFGTREIALRLMNNGRERAEAIVACSRTFSSNT